MHEFVRVFVSIAARLGADRISTSFPAEGVQSALFVSVHIMSIYTENSPRGYLMRFMGWVL